jgi:hypothetical protein
VSSESYIWQFTTGPDGNIYGATYPHALLIRITPGVAPNFTVLANVGFGQQYARSIAAYTGPKADGYIYLGIGSVVRHIVAYRIADNTFRDILPAVYREVGFSNVYMMPDGNIYGVASPASYPGPLCPTGATYFAVAQGTATEQSNVPCPLTPDKPVLSDGTLVDVNGDAGSIRICPPHSAACTSFTFTYEEPLPIFRVVVGPDGHDLFASTVRPAYLLTSVFVAKRRVDWGHEDRTDPAGLA